MSKPRANPIRTTAETKRWFESQGYAIAFVERFVRQVGTHGRKFDCFGIADHVAFSLTRPDVILVQSCAWDDMLPHLRKILSVAEIAPKWLAFKQRRIIVVGWKRGARKGDRLRRWTEEITATHFDELAAGRPVAFSSSLIEPADIGWARERLPLG